MPTARLQLLFCLLVLASASLAAQAPIGPLSRPGLVAVHATTPTELRAWDTAIDQMVRASQLIVLDSHADPDLEGRRHESLAQYYRGIPVYGGSLSRQTAQGVTVSIIGTVFDGISTDSAPTLSADQVVLALVEASAGRLVGAAPQLLIFPTLDGGYRLAYRATMSNTKTYIVDAAVGSVLWMTDEIQTQSQVGAAAVNDIETPRSS